MQTNINTTVLVTGGSGYLGVQCIIGLLEQGYTVKTTVRSLSKKQNVIDSLAAGGITAISGLHFIEADLTLDTNWENAVRGCTYVLHVASPFSAVDPEDENEIIVPARDGALRVLKASRDACVKRLVLTSSFAAIGYSIDPKDHVYTENDWTDPNTPGLRAYIKSKTIAEKAAWDFIAREGGGLELTVINPVAIFGPVLAGNYSASVEYVLKGILNGTIRDTPPFTFSVVDVRDTADIHLRAMTHPAAKGERFLASSGESFSFYDAAQLIRNERPEKAGSIADSLQQIDGSQYLYLSNEKARSVLGWHPRSAKETLLATVDSLPA